MENTTKPLPPWADKIPEGAFISYETTYKVGEYFSLFKKERFASMNCSMNHSMDYYFYDPTEHGREKGKEYPLFIFLHGATNALEGDVCINYAGAEFYATEEYQNDFGGAYLLVPLANEYYDEEKNLKGFWDDSYTEPLFNLINNFIQTKTNGVSKKVVFGNSSGATMSFKMVTAYTDFFDALIPIGSNNIPEDKILDEYDKNDVHLFFAFGKRDEFHSYEEEILPRIPRLEKMKHCFIFTPDWVYNGDGGVASINFGKEMGQHCLINSMHTNLKLDDGTILDSRLPNGVTGWLRDLLGK